MQKSQFERELGRGEISIRGRSQEAHSDEPALKEELLLYNLYQVLPSTKEVVLFFLLQQNAMQCRYIIVKMVAHIESQHDSTASVSLESLIHCIDVKGETCCGLKS